MSRRIASGLHKVATALRHGAQDAAQQRGLSPLQDRILLLLHAHESERARGAGLRPGVIARRLAVTAPTVSDAVRALEDKAMVVRRADPDDLRGSLVTLAAKGRKAAQRGSAWPDFLVEAIESLRVDEQTMLLQGVVKMVDVLADGGRIPAARVCTSCDSFRADVHRDPARPHHCAYADAPLGAADLRLDCPVHTPADPVRRAQNLRLLERR